MIITRDEAAKLMSKKIKVLLRFTKKPPEVLTGLDLVGQRESKTELIARAVVKSVREVDVDFFVKNPERIGDHGVRSLNGLKNHITTLYSGDLWDQFVQGKVRLKRISIDYSIAEEEKSKPKIN